MKAYVFPGQGAQSPGMGSDLYAGQKALFDQANDILGFNLSDIMFNGSMEDLTQTKVTQPAVFLHSIAKAASLGDSFQPDMVAGHSLGEFSALVAAKALTFEDALTLVSQRAIAMQSACELQPSTMAAIIGLDNDVVEGICEQTAGIVVPANYNSPGQLVISGDLAAIETACEAAKQAGARRALILPVGGAFHSPLMQPAGLILAAAVDKVTITKPICPIYQNVAAAAVTDLDAIRDNLKAQLTGSVKWSQSIRAMVSDGATSFTEVGPGRALQGMIRKISPGMEASSA
ncbi:MAG: ACP S-malonyltransferase [Flavobacteriales bacterium]|jgi:[acyl-carrier-protein] S-malonyltransferase|nr:ACP S-malonyltransferase [Flavobacteriales bacterium]MBT3572956.1 ACP S-malonyltransferase [Flavobacteriales bacterium]MBT3677795.1 ACP S-malonyltransferase [Flavobacteriales bacterium]MBT3739890.1 ACP S-malonyltransferase [Flavobacteriales bacterium]MBT4102022.1 ACP S-malonyltransferase [Flavobacteriales bacterium]